MSLSRAIKKFVNTMIDWRFERVHTHIPAVVVSYDVEMNTCSIQPCVKIFNSDDVDTGQLDLPQLDDIPVQFAGAGSVVLTSPVKAGTYGVYHVAEDDINQWIAQGGIVSPISTDRFNLDTGFFEPGIYPFDSSFSSNVLTDRISLRTKDGNTEISVLENGNIEINTTGTLQINGNTDAVALASKVDTFIGQIDDTLSNWTPIVNDGGAALKTYYVAAKAAGEAVSTVASNTVKVNS